MVENNNISEDMSQEDALELARKATGQASTGLDGLKQSLSNAIVDKSDGYGTDWAKVALLGGGALVGGLLSSGLGVGGAMGFLTIGIGAVLGAGAMSLFTDMILNFFREVEKPAIPPVVERPMDFKVNKKVITQEKLKLPEVTGFAAAEDIELPEYHPEEQPKLEGNPRLVEVQQTIETLRKAAAQGKPFEDGDNSSQQAKINAELRRLIDMLERDASTKELNLRYTRDEMAENLPAGQKQLGSYLTRLGVSTTQAAGITPTMDVSAIPGVHGQMPPELEKYGRQIMKYLIAAGKRPPIDEDGIAELQQDDARTALDAAYSGVDLSALSVDEVKAANIAWDALSIPHKKAIISNFAEHALRNSQGRQSDYRDFFDEEYFNFLNTGIRVHNKDAMLKKLNVFGEKSLYDQIVAADEKAHQTHDWGPLAELLEQRLHDARLAKDNGSPVMDEEHMQKLQVYILGMRGHQHLQNLDEYHRGPYLQQLKQLDHFNDVMLPQYGQQVGQLKGAMQGLEQTKILVLEQSPIVDNVQTLSVRDFRGATPQNLSVQITYKDGGKQLESVSITNETGQTLSAEVGGEAPQSALQKAYLLEQVLKGTGEFKTASLESPSQDQQYAAMLETGPRKVEEKEPEEPKPGLPTNIAVARPPARDDISVSHV